MLTFTSYLQIFSLNQYKLILPMELLFCYYLILILNYSLKFSYMDTKYHRSDPSPSTPTPHRSSSPLLPTNLMSKGKSYYLYFLMNPEGMFSILKFNTLLFKNDTFTYSYLSYINCKYLIPEVLTF